MTCTGIEEVIPPILAGARDHPYNYPALLIEHLQSQIELYRSRAKYKEPQDKDRALGLFESAIRELEKQRD